MSDLPAPEPTVNPETAAFWDATAEDRLLIGHCRSCDEYYYYPRRRCPLCSSTETEYVEASGRGVVYARTIVHQTGGPYGESTPYVLAYVELEEGPRMMTNVVGTDPETVAAGDEVEVVFDDAGEDAALPRFRPR